MAGTRHRWTRRRDHHRAGLVDDVLAAVMIAAFTGGVLIKGGLGIALSIVVGMLAGLAALAVLRFAQTMMPSSGRHGRTPEARAPGTKTRRPPKPH